MKTSPLFCAVLLSSFWLGCSSAPSQETKVSTCVKASDCDIGLACDRGRCVATLPDTQPIVKKFDGIPRVKVKSVAPFDLQMQDTPGNPVPEKIQSETLTASVPINELGIGNARIGMKRSEWFSVAGEFIPALPNDPPGVDARGITTMDGAKLEALFKESILCQLSTKSDRASTILGVRAGTPASRVSELYGALSDEEPRMAANLKGIFFRFESNKIPVDSGALPENAVVSEIIIGSCL